MAVMIFDQPAEALTSKLAKGLSYIAEQSGDNWILPTGTNAVSGDFISVDGIMGQATAAIVGGTDAIVEGTNWSQCPSGALNAANSSITWKSWHDENYNAGSYSTEVGLPTNWNELYVIVNMSDGGYAQTFPIIVVKSIAKDNDIYRIGFYAGSNDYARVHFRYYSNKIRVTDAQIKGSNYPYELRIGYR